MRQTQKDAEQKQGEMLALLLNEEDAGERGEGWVAESS